MQSPCEMEYIFTGQIDDFHLPVMTANIKMWICTNVQNLLQMSSSTDFKENMQIYVRCMYLSTNQTNQIS